MTTKGTDTLPFLLSDTARMMQAMMERRIARTGFDITPGEARTLFFASIMGGPPQTKLARRMLVDPMTVSDYVCKLEREELVVRERDPADRRIKMIVATEKAEPVLAVIREITETAKSQACGDLNHEDRTTLTRLLASVRSNLCDVLLQEGCADGCSGTAQA